MKLVKSYTAKITGNADKISNLNFILNQLEEMSVWVFSLGVDAWFNQKSLYHAAREKWPLINSDIVQKFLKQYLPIKGRKLPKQPVRPNIFLYWFNLEFDSDTKYTNYWLRFGRRNYPLRGKRILSRIRDVSGVKFVTIFRKNKKIYCKMTYVEEIPEITGDPTKSVGIDFNIKRIVSSNNKFYNLKQYVHRKSEYRKNKGKRNINNYTKNFVHSLSNKITKDLCSSESKVLVLENLKDLRKSSSKKNGTSKGKTVNYLINNAFPYWMLKQILEYKCLEHNILVKTINPAYTSQECGRCGSLETVRLQQSRLVCKDCGFRIDADLNASRNIRNRYIESNGSPVNPTRLLSEQSSCPL